MNCLPSGGCGHSGILQDNTSMCSRSHSEPLPILSNILLPSLHLGPISMLQTRDPVLQAKVVPSHVILFWNDHGTTNCLLILLSVPVAHVAVQPVQDVHSDIKQSPEKIKLDVKFCSFTLEPGGGSRHGWLLQTSILVGKPGQCPPPGTGGIQSHLRLHSCNPGPHVLLQLSHCSHSAQWQLPVRI